MMKMDLFNILYYSALFLVPFVVYSVIFKKNKRSLYSNRDWFHLIKLYYAKNAVKTYQEKYRIKRKNLGNKGDHILDFPTDQHSNYQYIQGADQKGNNLSLRFILTANTIAEVFLILRLRDGGTYTFPETDIRVSSVNKNQYKINGLIIEILEPFTRLRLTFNGLLKDVSKPYEKIEHIQFNFIFSASGSPKYYPEDVNVHLLANSVAREDWKDGFWKDLLVDQSGYDQFGSLLGIIKGDSFQDGLTLNLACSRSKYSGIDDRFLVNREIRIFLVDEYGVLINVIIKSFENGMSQLNYGYVIKGDSVIVPITGLDIRLQNIAPHKIIPNIFVAHIETEYVTYKCVFHVNTKQAITSVYDSNHGYEIFNVPAECDINTTQGRVILELWYKKNGDEQKTLPHPLLHYKKVKVLPNILVSNINSEESKILNLTGGKGNSLALLSSINTNEFLVPPGFIVTVKAFQKQLENIPKLKKSILILDDICCGRKEGKLEEACKETVQMLKNEPVSSEILEAIETELKNVEQSSTKDDIDIVKWAVRSSAIGEDSEELSAAGQNETFLGCHTKDVVKAVASCWASLFTYQSVQYRWQHGLPVVSDMAVVVQKMVPSDSAGVLFTWHPTTNDPAQMVITANFGLGESVVSGQSDPDTFILNKTWDGRVCLIDHNIGAKNKIMKMTENGVEEVYCSFVSVQDHTDFEIIDDKRWSITQDQAFVLGKVGVLLEQVFGGPRDIEWSFYKDKLYLLQSRPITTLNTWSEFELTHEFDSAVLSENSVYTMANTGEVFPNALTVLSQTSSLPPTERGLQIHTRQDFDPLVRKAVVTFQHHVIIDVVNCIHKNQSEDIKLASKILDLAVFGHPVLNERINTISLNRHNNTRLNQIKAILHLARTAWQNNAIGRKIKEASRNFKIDIKCGDTLQGMYKKISEAIEQLTEIGLYHSQTSGTSVLYQILTMNLLAERNNELTMDHYTDYASILSSCEDVVSAEVPTLLENIAKIIRDQGYDEEFCNIKPEFGVAWLEKKCPQAYKSFEEFLDKHGHRTIREFEMMEESWAMNPSKVISMVQANAKHQRMVVERNILPVDEVIKNLKSPKSSVTRYLIKFLMPKMRTAVGVREQSKSELISSLHKLKIAFRQMANKMVLQGVLPSRNLIYHLSHHEIGQVISRQCPLLISKAMMRQRLFSKWWGMKFPEVMYGLPEPEIEKELPPEISGKVCTGTPVCTGTVTARACVITSLDNIDQLQKGDILITYSTDIGWSPYFPMLSGVVTEIGGLVSHGAVVAREYGLPCIVAVQNATKLFKTGDTVFLSGKTGEIGKV